MWKTTRRSNPLLGSPIEKRLKNKKFQPKCAEEKILVFAYETTDAEDDDGFLESNFECLVFQGTSKWLLSKACKTYDKSIGNKFEN